jgi:hypothetical protein
MSAKHLVGPKGFIRAKVAHKFLLVVLNHFKVAGVGELSASIACDINYVQRHLTQMKRKGILVTNGKNYMINTSIGWK